MKDVDECVTVVAVTVGLLPVTLDRPDISVTAAARMAVELAAAVGVAQPYCAPLRAALETALVYLASRPRSMMAAVNVNNMGSTMAASTAATPRRRAVRLRATNIMAVTLRGQN